MTWFYEYLPFHSNIASVLLFGIYEYKIEQRAAEQLCVIEATNSFSYLELHLSLVNIPGRLESETQGTDDGEQSCTT